VLQVQGRAIVGTLVLVATPLVAQTKRVRGAAPDIILAAVDRLVLLVLMVEMPAQVPAEQLQQTPGAGQLLRSIAGMAVQLLLLLLLAQIHGGTGRRTAAGARLGAIIGRQSIHNDLGFYCVFFFLEYFLVHFLALALCFSSSSGFYSVFNAFPMELVDG